MSTRFGSAVPRSAILGLLLLSACSTFDSDKGAPPPPPYMPVEFAMPAGSSIDRGNTIVVGDNLNWFGTLAITSDSGMDEAHQFYASELPREGWEPVSALMANRVVLQFINHHQNRASIVTIESRTIGGSHIEIIVAPLIAHSQTADERASERMNGRDLPPPPRSAR